jgi:hypothetical protein
MDWMDRVQFLAGERFLSFSQLPDWLWHPPSLFKWYWELFHQDG